MMRPGRFVGAAALLAIGSCTRPADPTPVVVAIPVYVPPANPNPPSSSNPPRTQPRNAPADVPAGVRDAGEATIRVLLRSSSDAIVVASSGPATFFDRNGDFAGGGAAGGSWRIERDRRRLRLGSRWFDGELQVRGGTALLSVSGRPYRGDLTFIATDTGITVVNTLRIDDYLKGVVPGEIGTRSMADSAAVQAQAITARSYAYIHLAPSLSRPYDVTSGVQDQVYGGAAVETEVSSQAVESTRTLVLKYAGRVVNAPYSSTCGGTTAAASEVWRSADEPYLTRVSDQIPNSGRYYCDIAPRFRWSRTLDGTQLNAALTQYLASYVSVPGRQPGVARNVAIASRTASGRVGTLLITTDRGSFTLRGNDIRYVLRAPGAEILNSTYFSVLATPGTDGSVAKLTLNGTGYGHGVGMCQWGAIGRARAGQDYRTILRTYYPGTTVGPAQ